MREKKFTKGPWTLREHPSNDDFFVEAENHGYEMTYNLDVCGEDYTGFGDEDVRRANYTLISSAPELLEALEMMVDFEERARKQQEKMTGHEFATSFEAINARIAIAKSYGETE